MWCLKTQRRQVVANILQDFWGNDSKRMTTKSKNKPWAEQTSGVGVASSLAPPTWHFLMQTQSVLICQYQNNFKKSQIFVLYFHLSADLFSFSYSWFVWMRNVPRNNPFNLIEVHKGLQFSEFIVSFSQRSDFPHVPVFRLLSKTCIKQMQRVKKKMDHMT